MTRTGDLVSAEPTTFHITHWKAGSQWVAEILRYAAPYRFVKWTRQDPRPAFKEEQGPLRFYTEPLRPGSLYGTVYLRRRRFEDVLYGRLAPAGGEPYFFPARAVRNWWNFAVRRRPWRCFVVIRDLRDTLVSQYFSDGVHHVIANSEARRRREALNQMNQEDGLLRTLETRMERNAAIQTSWLDDPEVLVLRYEDILGNEYEFFERLVDYCRIYVPRKRLHDIIYYNIFETATGRQRGQEDVHSHLRKGVAGDWRNFFTDAIKTQFKKRFGDVLVKTGYETDLNW